MAGLAFDAVAAGVCIFDPVAIGTSFPDAFPLLRGMASYAGDFLVLSCQRKLSLAMIERFGGEPANDVMARLALVSETALMRLILFVTANTR